MKRKARIIIFTFLLFGVTAFSNIPVSLSPAKIIVNERPAKTGELPIFNYKNRTYVPLREIAENIGADVSYNADTKLISISYPEDRPIHSQVNDTATHGSLTLTIYSEKETYSENDIIRVWASFNNSGEETVIFSGEPLFVFYLIDSQKHKKYEILGLAHVTRNFKMNDEYRRDLLLYKLGGERQFDKKLSLPKGTYTLGAETKFRLKQDTPAVNLNTEINITVE